MTEVLDLRSLVDQFFNPEAPTLTPVERVLLANDGTVQTLLSVLFGLPVRIKLVDQSRQDTIITRKVHLTVNDFEMGPGTVVCEATTKVDTNFNSPSILQQVWSGQEGLGQIIVRLGFSSHRDLNTFGADEESFYREYTLWGSRRERKQEEFFKFLIHETFPRAVFEELS